MYKHSFVTAALPYANGYLHLGHILEFIQTDIWVRFRQYENNFNFYFSGIDAHGTPVMLKSLDNKTRPETLINNFLSSYKNNLKFFNIKCDNFYKTNSYENEILVRNFFFRLYEKNLLFVQNITQLYDPTVEMFLPDRYVLGTCPKCMSNNEYGDICGQCNFNYLAVDLIDPVSKLSGQKPVKKIAQHYFFKFKTFSNFLESWCSSVLNQSQVLNKLKEWFNIGFCDWDISRNTPYFGIKIPLEYDKFFYVWVDAPLGYFASAQHYFKKFSINFFDIFLKKKYFNVFHFIGKDIIYFHCLFLPAILKALNYPLPENIFTHGFLTINNFKMSKSTSTFILANDLMNLVKADFLRFYLALKLHNGLSDIDFSFSELSTSINSILIGKFLNIINRVSKILYTQYNSILSKNIDAPVLFDDFFQIKKMIFDNYDNRHYSKVLNLILCYADKINIYLDKEKPWHLAQNVVSYKKGHDVCTAAFNLFCILLYYLTPIIPDISDEIQKSFKINCSDLFIERKPFLSLYLNKYEYFVCKIKE